MTTTTDTIAAHAARLEAARFHAHCDAHDPCVGIDGMERQHRLGDPPPPGLAFHTEDHRTPAERKAAALASAATLWVYFEGDAMDYREYLSLMFDHIQRGEEP